MRAASSAGVIKPPNVSRACPSRSEEKASLRQASCKIAEARATSPRVKSALANAKCPLGERGGSLAKKAITVCGSLGSCQRAASARRRRGAMLGQLGLALMKAIYREKSFEPSSLRRITHSTSLRASGSVIEFAAVVASSWRFLRSRSIACFTADRSIGEVAVVAAVANGTGIRGAGFVWGGGLNGGRPGAGGGGLRIRAQRKRSR